MHGDDGDDEDDVGREELHIAVSEYDEQTKVVKQHQNLSLFLVSVLILPLL